MRMRLMVVICALALAMVSWAAPITLALTVDGLQRTALLYPGKNAQNTPAPVVLSFHGFLGNAGQMARSVRFQDEWPEATVVYPQGLEVTALRRQGPGWQEMPGHLGDRDIHFVDALLQELPKHGQVDTRRVYVTGMSLGAIFSYELFATRADKFAAFAPVAGWAYFLRNATIPRPFLIIQGSADRLVKPAWAEATRDTIRRINQCGDQTVEWAPGYQSYQPCRTSMPVIWHQHDGGHMWPKDATTYIVKFFKEQVLRDGKPA